MARHFVAVCVVCLLCADHLPCKEHFEGVASGGGQYRGNSDYLRSGPDLERFSRDVGGDLTPVMLNDKGHDHMVQTHTRRKRHSVHLHDDHEGTIATNENSRQYIKKIFDRFGDGDAKVMNLVGFEDMLHHLGLTKLLVQEGRQFIEEDPSDDNSCMNTYDFMTRISPNERRAQEPNTPKVAKRAVRSLRTLDSSINDLTAGSAPVTKSEDAYNSSVITNRNAETNNRTNEDRLEKGSGGPVSNGRNGRDFAIDTESLFNICPILLHQLLTPNNISCLSATSLAAAEPKYPVIEDDRTLVWIYATASVLGVSLCGLLGFAVIPCMEKSFYQTMLQFLVALAVGTLAGDALLHLLPHAMILSIETASPDNVHQALTMKGLVAVLGIVAFFGIERGLTMIAEWRKERQKKLRQKLPQRVRVMKDPESVSLNNSEKQCKHKYSSYPYCYDEIAMDSKEDHNHHSHHHPHGHEKKPVSSVSTTSIGQVFKPNSVLPLAARGEETSNHHLHFDHSQLNHHHNHHNNHETGPAVVMANNNGISSNKSQSKTERLNSAGSNNNNADNNTISTNLEDSSSIESSWMLKPVKAEESYTVILREHESKHHGHSHTHGHVHSPPGSLSAVAWMVIMGDGLHNFTDGMAIGAAFSNNIAGGFSTAIAVFCHELPHELGDFAVLLKAGMSVRKAVYYNLLSSILSFLGMVLGVAIGDTPEASAWIFAIAAGLFLYIALVDMVPELTSSHHERCAGSNTLLQVLGMSAGLVIMLLIALNEEDLKSLFAENGHGHHHH